ncbi:MAG: hypothetical protein SH850_26080 [Planctomycetaceae bacterium]|nr:hypothetical protein [Planctomycetaceae bacterium]
MLRNWSRRAVCALAATLVCGLLPASAWAQRNTNGEFYFVHGLPGTDIGQPNSLPVDVCIGIPGSGTLNCFYLGVEFGTFRGPIELAEGVYQVTVGPADPVNPGSQPPIISGIVTIQARQSKTFVAHLTQFGAPIGTEFENDVARVLLVNGRATVRHTAAAGPVDVSLMPVNPGPGVTATGLANPQQSSPVSLKSGTYVARLKAAGQPNDLIPSRQLTIAPSNAYFVYVVGSPGNGTLQFLVQNFRLKPKLTP